MVMAYTFLYGMYFEQLHKAALETLTSRHFLYNRSGYLKFDALLILFINSVLHKHVALFLFFVGISYKTMLCVDIMTF